jgi:hypothetical protein
MSFFFIDSSEWRKLPPSEKLHRIAQQAPVKRYYRRPHLVVEPADAVVTRVFTELQQHRSPQRERNLFTRLIRRLLALPSPDRAKE